MGFKNNKKTKRLFLALWPDDSVRRQLNEVLQHTAISITNGNSPVCDKNLHMTLLFLGDVQVKDMQNLMISLDSVSLKPFTLSIDSWGHFHKPGILWLGASDIPEDLHHLYKQLKTMVAKHTKGVVTKTFKPHITVLRNIESLPQVDNFEQIEWFVDSFVLVESVLRSEGAEYRVLKEWSSS